MSRALPGSCALPARGENAAGSGTTVLGVCTDPLCYNSFLVQFRQLKSVFSPCVAHETNPRISFSCCGNCHQQSRCCKFRWQIDAGLSRVPVVSVSGRTRATRPELCDSLHQNWPEKPPVLKIEPVSGSARSQRKNAKGAA